MTTAIDAEKAFYKIQHPFNYKGLGEIMDIKNISKRNKSNIQQADSQQQIKWREAQSDSTKIRNKTRLSVYSLHIYSI